MSKKVEREVLDLLNQNDSANFIALPNRFSHTDLAGTIKTIRIMVEVKNRQTPYNYGDMDGWLLELSKIQFMMAQCVQLDADPDTTDMLYVNKYDGEFYVFDIKDCEHKKPMVLHANAETYFGGGDAHKIDKMVYKLKNDECLLRRNNLKSIAELYRLY